MLQNNKRKLRKFLQAFGYQWKYFNELIPKIDNNNSAKEFYLTDLIGIASDIGFKINTLTSTQNETMGANSE